MKMFELQIKFHWNSIRQLASSDNDLAPSRRQAITWTNNDQVYLFSAKPLSELSMTKFTDEYVPGARLTIKMLSKYSYMCMRKPQYQIY